MAGAPVMTHTGRNLQGHTPIAALPEDVYADVFREGPALSRFTGSQYPDRDLHPERYDAAGQLLPEFASAAPALALGDVTRGRKNAIREGN